MNAQDVNVPDPPLQIFTAPACCFKNRTEKENRLKENENTNYKKKLILENVDIKKEKKLVNSVLQSEAFNLICEL